MSDGYQFRLRRRPPAVDYLSPALATLIALWLSIGPIEMTFQADQNSGLPARELAQILLAVAMWLAARQLWSRVTMKTHHFDEGEPVLIIDERGISTMNWLGRATAYAWSDISSERVEAGGERRLLFKARGVRRSVALRELSTDPDTIARALTAAKERSTSRRDAY